jgi:hypothetical protein
VVLLAVFVLHIILKWLHAPLQAEYNPFFHDNDFGADNSMLGNYFKDPSFLVFFFLQLVTILVHQEFDDSG